LGGACNTYETDYKHLRISVEKSEGKRPFGRPGVDGRMIL